MNRVNWWGWAFAVIVEDRTSMSTDVDNTVANDDVAVAGNQRLAAKGVFPLEVQLVPVMAERPLHQSLD